jgi:hypothetical protein
MMAARRVQMPLPVLVSQTPLSSGALPTTSARLLMVNVGGFVGAGRGTTFVASEDATTFVLTEGATTLVASEVRTIKGIPAKSAALVMNTKMVNGPIEPHIFLIIISIPFQFVGWYASPWETQGDSEIVATQNRLTIVRLCLGW